MVSRAAQDGILNSKGNRASVDLQGKGKEFVRDGERASLCGGKFLPLGGEVLKVGVASDF